MEKWLGHEREEAQALEEAPCVEPCVRPGSSHRRHTDDGNVVDVDFPDTLPVTGEEIALLRAFLHDEIRAILCSEDPGG